MAYNTLSKAYTFFHFFDRANMASIKDVAKAAGVSTATVSRVIANKGYITDEKRQLVLRAIEELKYRPNLIARSLRAQTSTKIGLVVSDIRNPFFTAIARAVEDAAYERGYSIIICNTDENPEKEQLYLNLMHDENVAGVIFSPTQQFGLTRKPYQTHIPFVIIDRRVDNNPNYDTVMLDNIAAAYTLTEHLISQEYRRLTGFFGDTSTTGFDRREGFERAIRQAGLEHYGAHFIAPRIEQGYQSTLELLNNNVKPDAIFTSNNLITVGVFQALRANKIRIPQDIALVGFDETTWGNVVEPPLTIISQPTEDIGRSAIELLLQRIEMPDRPHKKLIMQGVLQVKGSSIKQPS